MNTIVSWLKAHLPQPIKNALKPIYFFLIKLRYVLFPKSYQQQKEDEINRFNQEENVNDLPEIFHYWSNKYLAPKFQNNGFSSPDDFFLQHAIQAIRKNKGTTSILSIGAGNCDTEVDLAKNLTALSHDNFIIECMDINQVMIDRGKKLAVKYNVEKKLGFIQADFNHWEASNKYELIIANQSLHHVVELEHLFDNIQLALSDQGQFITSDVIGRNGHMRWPEALKLLNPIWKNMPDRYKYNHLMKRFETKYINHDCSTEGFEGIRAQDVLPLLVERFEFDQFIPFANLIMVFIDRPFGPNFDHKNPADLAFIDQIQELDEQHIASGVIKPTQMLAAMKLKTKEQAQQSSNQLSPESFVRHT